jgi:UDP-N-acetylmuramoyl-tripeptide--D-alanyl-D-alanine ligase
MQPVPVSSLIDAVHGAAPTLKDADFSLSRVCIDSREIERGDLFWCLKGEKHDAHDFIGQALQRGASACVVERVPNGFANAPTIAVQNTLAALGDFARWYRHQQESLIIGVTGSVGKTSTREMIHAVLSSTHSGRQSLGNFNNEIGLPLSLLQLETGDEFGVFEMGARKVGDIRALCEIACPEVGVITRIGLAHLESFGSQQNIFLGKGELLDALPPHGFAVIGGDDERMKAMARRAACHAIFIGEKPGNHVRAVDVKLSPGRLQFTVDRKKYELHAVGRHYLTAALCAIAVAREIGLESADIAAGLKEFKGQPGRCRLVIAGEHTVIDDSYNSNPTSLVAASECLAEYPTKGRRILITGDMLELGQEAASLHSDVGQSLAARHVDAVAALGTHAGDLCGGAIAGGMRADQLAACHDLDSLLTVLDCWINPGDVVLVKGSRGMQMERVVQWLADREQAVVKEINARQSRRAVA